MYALYIMDMVILYAVALYATRLQIIVNPLYTNTRHAGGRARYFRFSARGCA